MSDEDIKNAAHREAMKVLKAEREALMATKTDEAPGLLLVHTGNGKGKSSSGFGMVVRAMGHGMHTGVVQFIKGAIPSGEEMFLQRFPDQCEFHVMGEGYTWETQDRTRDVAKAEAACDKQKEPGDILGPKPDGSVNPVSNRRAGKGAETDCIPKSCSTKAGHKGRETWRASADVVDGAHVAPDPSRQAYDCREDRPAYGSRRKVAERVHKGMIINALDRAAKCQNKKGERGKNRC